MAYELKTLTPMLETADIKATIDFYTTVLGFRCNNFSEDSGWASLSKDNVDIMFSGFNEHRGFIAAAMSGSLYLNVDNIDTVWATLKDNCKVCYPIDDFDYGMREFAVFDNNGYLLQFGQAIEQQA